MKMKYVRKDRLQSCVSHELPTSTRLTDANTCHDPTPQENLI